MTAQMYTPEQMEKICDRIRRHFGGDGEDGMIAHELRSEFVHTDTMILAPKGEIRTFVTFGMGAGATASPLPEFQRIELVLSASAALEVPGTEAFQLASELTDTGKYPFREDSWFGPGHTINVSRSFKERFGFGYFLFLDAEFSVRLEGVGTVRFLRLVPIYDEEREWIVLHDGFAFARLLYDAYGEDIFLADSGRPPLVPEGAESPENSEDEELAAALGIELDTFQRLGAFISAQHAAGRTVSYEMIDAWLRENT